MTVSRTVPFDPRPYFRAYWAAPTLSGAGRDAVTGARDRGRVTG
jgi:hypothetical protein